MSLNTLLMVSVGTFKRLMENLKGLPLCRVVLVALLSLSWIGFLSAATLQWSASVVDEDHAAPTGYRIHRGAAPGVYDWQLDVGNTLQWPIPDDLFGSYYWAASAYNAAGSSGYSNEVFWQRAPPEPPQYIGATNLRSSKLQQKAEHIMAVSSPRNIQHIDVAPVGESTITLSNYAVGSEGNRCLIVEVHQNYYAAANRPTGVVFNTSETFTVIAQSPSSSWGQCSAWRLVNPSNTTANIVVSFSSLSGGQSVVVVAYYLDGVDQTTPVPSGDVVSGYTTASSHTISPTNLASGDLAIGLGSSDNGVSSYSVSTGTLIYESCPAGSWTDQGSGYNTGTGTVSVVLAHTSAPTGWVGFRVAASSGGGVSALPVFMKKYRARRE